MLRNAIAIAIFIGVQACASPSSDPLAGRYLASGGGGALPQIQALTKRFSELHPGVTWQIDNVGSTAAIQLVRSSAVDVGFVSREVKPEERKDLELLSLGVVGTGVAVNAQNPISSLTKEQVRAIFMGTVTDWREVGGVAAKIRVIVREEGASTRSAFEEYFFPGASPGYATGASVTESLDEMVSALGSIKDGIGMVSLNDRTWNEPRIRIVSLDGVPGTRESLQSGAYPVRRPLYLVYASDLTKVRPGVRQFLDFVRSPEGQRILAGL